VLESQSLQRWRPARPGSVTGQRSCRPGGRNPNAGWGSAHETAAEGAEAVGSKPEEFSAFLKSEIDKWGKVVKAAGIPMQ